MKPYKKRVTKWFCPYCEEDFWEEEGAKKHLAKKECALPDLSDRTFVMPHIRKGNKIMAFIPVHMRKRTRL